MQMCSDDNCENQSINKLTGKFLSTVWCKNGETVQKNVQQTTQLCYQQQQHNNTYTFVTVVQFKMHYPLSLSLPLSLPISICHCMLLVDSSRSLRIDDMLRVTVLAYWEKLSVIINCRARAVQLYSQSCGQIRVTQRNGFSGDWKKFSVLTEKSVFSMVTEKFLSHVWKKWASVTTEKYFSVTIKKISSHYWKSVFRLWLNFIFSDDWTLISVLLKGFLLTCALMNGVCGATA